MRIRSLVLPLLVAACGSSRPTPVPADEAGPSRNLAVSVPFTQLQIPADSRGGQAAEVEIPLSGWEQVDDENGSSVFTTALPVRSRALFFVAPPRGMTLRDSKGRAIRHATRSRVPSRRTYSLGRTLIRLRLPPGSQAPADGEYKLRWKTAKTREDRLNHAFSGLASAEDFVRARVFVGRESREGLLLPAPSTVAWQVEVPPAGELHFSPGLVIPEIADLGASDGATLRVEVEADGKTTPVWLGELATEDWPNVILDLSAWSGKAVTLRMETEAGASTLYDYAFVGDPILASHEADPQKLLVIFVDTLRPDHLSPYGYRRDTTPNLAALAERGVVFDNARTIAPWTLPSTRTIVTGRYPERWNPDQTLQSALRQEGFATGLFGGNMYLSTAFGIARNWGVHRVVNAPSATTQTDQAIAWWQAHSGRDRLLLVHYMDPHLPYREPSSFRRKYAGEPHPALGETFRRRDVNGYQGKLPDEARSYLIDRYDNNVAYTDHEIGRLLRAVGEDTHVVFLSDHGEEFWEHTRFEHGHSLFDEVMRVPLIVAGPGIEPGRQDEDVALLDVTPTVLELAGAEPLGEVDGTSVVDLIGGGSAAPFQDRSLAFGHPLYGSEQWGALRRRVKYKTSEGREAAYDLGKDEAERKNLIANKPLEAGAPYRSSYEDAMGQPLRLAYRLVNSRPPNRDSGEPMVVKLHVPGGIAAAWIGADPGHRSSATISVVEDFAVIEWEEGRPGYREAYIVPEAPVEEVTHKLVLSVSDGRSEVETRVNERIEATPGARRVPLLRQRTGDRRGVVLTWGLAPQPEHGGASLDAYDPEVVEMLRAAGYVVGDDAEGDEDGEEEEPASDDRDEEVSAADEQKPVGE